MFPKRVYWLRITIDPRLKKETAILLFALDPSDEIKRKSLTRKKNKGLNRRIFSRLNSKALGVAKSTQLPVFLSQEIPHSGDTFGTKISTCAAYLFGLGYEKLILIGNDCPSLSKTQILEANAQLENYAHVVGPDQRGGTYLIGLHARDFDPKSFQNLQWESNSFFTSYIQFTNDAAFRLSMLSDLHSFRDVLTYEPSVLLVRLIKEWILDFYNSLILHRTEIYANPVFYTSKQLRAPPSPVFFAA